MPDATPIPVQREPWERQHGETDRAWHAFVTYRDLGRERSYAKVADILGISPPAVRYFGKPDNGDWRERVEAYDRHMANERIERQLYALDEMGERHAQVTQAQIMGLSLPARALLEKLQSDPEIVMNELRHMPVTELVSLIARISGTLPAVLGAERISRGITAERAEADNTIEVEALDHSELADDSVIADVVTILSEARLLGPVDGGEGEDLQADASEADEIHTPQADAEASDLPEPPP